MKLTIANTDIHQDAEGRFSLNDLHRAAVGAGNDYKTCQVEHFMRNDKTQELTEEIRRNGELEIDPIASKAGRYGGTYVAKELVYAYAMWISPKFHLQVIRTFDAVATGDTEIAGDVLPSIRKTGSYAAPAAVVPAPTIEAFKLAPLVVRAARALGLDKNAAAISANQAVTKLTGTNVLKLLGHQHLEADNQTAMYFTPTELGERMGISGRKFNMLMAEAGLQAKKGEHWVPLAAAEGFYRFMDTSKRHGDGTMIQQVKWAENVLALVEKAAA